MTKFEFLLFLFKRNLKALNEEDKDQDKNMDRNNDIKDINVGTKLIIPLINE